MTLLTITLWTFQTVGVKTFGFLPPRRGRRRLGSPDAADMSLCQDSATRREGPWTTWKGSRDEGALT